MCDNYNMYIIQNIYKEDYEKNKTNVIPISETAEMKIAKEIHDIQSKESYTKKAKQSLQNVKFGSGEFKLLLKSFKSTFNFCN